MVSVILTRFSSLPKSDMPSFNIDVDFEVYCGTCGEGLCLQTETPRTLNRNALSVRVDVCGKCISRKDDAIADLEEQVAGLNREVQSLKDRINELER